MCRTTVVLAATASAVALSLTGCGGDATTPATSAVAQPPLPVSALPDPATLPPRPSATAAVPPPGAASPIWVMPDLVGANLQEAQDTIQSLTDFGIAVTTSTDATGDDRAQVLDRNWKVCSQNVSAGTTIVVGTLIDFGTVKLDESC